MLRSRRLAGAALTAAAAFLIAPSTGLALSGVTITDDAGATVPIANGMVMRNMSPLIAPAFSNGDAYYQLTLTQPTGTTDSLVSSGSCASVSSAQTSGFYPAKAAYAGPGAYSVSVTTYTQAQYDSRSFTCGQSSPNNGTFTASFTISPAVSLGTFPTTLLTRAPSGKTIAANTTYPIPFNANPGADANELVINGPNLPEAGSTRAFDPATNTAPVVFYDPGTYLLTPRATDYAFAQPVLGPQVTVTVKDPFDFSAPGFYDSTGPVYKWLGFTRTKYMTGSKLKFEIRSKGAKKFRTVARAKVRKSRAIKFRMKIVKTGKYDARIKFKGNSRVAGGTYKASFRIRHRRL